MSKIMIVGAGGHANVILDILSAVGLSQKVACITDENQNLHGKEIQNISIMGGANKWQEIYEAGVQNAIIAIGDNHLRKQNFTKLQQIGFHFPAIIHPHAWVSPSATLGQGTVVMAGAVIQNSAFIGDQCIVNTSASVDHDCQLQAYVHCAPGVHLGGNVHIGEGTLVGLGSSVIPGVKIGQSCTIGAGSVVIQNLPDQSKAYGNPAKVAQAK